MKNIFMNMDRPKSPEERHAEQQKWAEREAANAKDAAEFRRGQAAEETATDAAFGNMEDKPTLRGSETAEEQASAQKAIEDIRLHADYAAKDLEKIAKQHDAEAALASEKAKIHAELAK